jgi:hypothetical protein
MSPQAQALLFLGMAGLGVVLVMVGVCGMAGLLGRYVP